MSLCFMERLMLSELVQLVSHLGGLRVLQLEGGFLQLKHFHLLQGDVNICPSPPSCSLSVILVLCGDSGRLKPFSLTRPQNGCCGLACGCAGDLAVLSPSFHCRNFFIAELLLFIIPVSFDSFMEGYG